MARHSFSFDLILVGLPGRFKRWLRLTRQQLARSAEILSRERDPSIDLGDAQEVVGHRTISFFLHQFGLAALDCAFRSTRFRVFQLFRKPLWRPANNATAWPPCSWVELQAVLDTSEF